MKQLDQKESSVPVPYSTPNNAQKHPNLLLRQLPTQFRFVIAVLLLLFLQTLNQSSKYSQTLIGDKKNSNCTIDVTKFCIGYPQIGLPTIKLKQMFLSTKIGQHKSKNLVTGNILIQNLCTLPIWKTYEMFCAALLQIQRYCSMKTTKTKFDMILVVTEILMP